MSKREAERVAIVKWLRGKHAFELVSALRYDDVCGAGDDNKSLTSQRAIELVRALQKLG